MFYSNTFKTIIDYHLLNILFCEKEYYENKVVLNDVYNTVFYYNVIDKQYLFTLNRYKKETFVYDYYFIEDHIRLLNLIYNDL
jgi:hypothetical protein